MAHFELLKKFLGLLAAEADRRIRATLAVSLAFALVGSALAGLAPVALKSLIDTMSAYQAAPDATQGRHAALFGAGYLLALGLGRLLSDLRPMLAGRAEQQLHASISRRYFAHLLELPFSFHAGRQTGGLTYGLTQATVACHLVTNSLMQCTPVIAELAMVLAVLVHLGQPALTVVFMASAVAYGFVFATGAQRIRAHGRAVTEAGAGMHASLADSLLNIEAIKCFNADGTQRERFDVATSELEGRWSGLHRQRTRTALQLTAVFTASIGASLFVATEAMSRHALTTGGFVLVTVYMLQMVRPIELLGTFVRDVSQALEFARPLLEVLGTGGEGSVEQDLPHDVAATGTAPPAIGFQDVHFAYDKARPVLSGFTLEVPAGATVAIVGPSGAGKSSIARLLQRLLEPQAGTISWGQGALHRIPLRSLRSQIGFVPQDATLLNDSIAANIALGRPGASPAEIEQAARRAQIHTFVGSLPDGYDTTVGERGLKLSGGERQRIAIARAILRRPRVYVFDEVSSMLDAPTEAALLRDLKEICAGCTTIFITHRLAAARTADLIAVLADGKVVESGNHAELLVLGGRYADMWRAQTPEGACLRDRALHSCARNACGMSPTAT